MELTENTALVLIVSGFTIVILGGYAIWRGYLKPFLGKRRFLISRIENAPNQDEVNFWSKELKNYYIEHIPILRNFYDK